MIDLNPLINATSEGQRQFCMKELMEGVKGTKGNPDSKR